MTDWQWPNCSFSECIMNYAHCDVKIEARAWKLNDNSIQFIRIYLLSLFIILSVVHLLECVHERIDISCCMWTDDNDMCDWLHEVHRKYIRTYIEDSLCESGTRDTAAIWNDWRINTGWNMRWFLVIPPSWYNLPLLILWDLLSYRNIQTVIWNFLIWIQIFHNS